MKIKLVIFDFWGTLAYSPKKDWKDFYYSLRDFGIELKTKEEIKYFSSFFSKLMCISKDWIDFSQQLLKDFIKNPKEEEIKSLACFLEEKVIFNLYDDVKEVLDLPFQKAILTDSSKFLVETSDLQGFGPIFTPRETKSSKPDPKVFLTVIEALKVKPEEALMVGDDIERDLVTAKNLGMKTVLIDRENKFPDYKGVRINSFRELKNLLESN